MSRANKDKDQQFKLLADDDPRATLHLFAGLPVDAPAVVTPVGRDIMPAKLMDHAFHVDIDGTSKIHHFEATTSYYYVKDLNTVYDYSVLLEIDHGMAVQTKIVLMSSRGMPEEVPTTFTVDRGGSTTRVHRVEFVRVWQIPAALALDQDRLAILPWGIPMDATPEEEREAQRRIAASDRAKDLAASIAILAGCAMVKMKFQGGSRTCTAC